MEDAQRLSRTGEGKSCAQFVRIRTGQGHLSLPAKGMRSAEDDNTRLSCPEKKNTRPLDKTTTRKMSNKKEN